MLDRLLPRMHAPPARTATPMLLRRTLLSSSAIATVGLLTGCLPAVGTQEAAAAPLPPPAPSPLLLSLNAYSFNKLLDDRSRGRGPGISLVEVMEFAQKCGCAGFDATGNCFPGYPKAPSDGIVDAFVRRTRELGLGISGSGVRSNFTTADKAVRNAGIAHIKEWVEVAARLGAPVLRVFADTLMRTITWETVSACRTMETSCAPGSSSWIW